MQLCWLGKRSGGERLRDCSRTTRSPWIGGASGACYLPSFSPFPTSAFLFLRGCARSRVYGYSAGVTGLWRRRRKTVRVLICVARWESVRCCSLVLLLLPRRKLRPFGLSRRQGLGAELWTSLHLAGSDLCSCVQRGLDSDYSMLCCYRKCYF